MNGSFGQSGSADKLAQSAQSQVPFCCRSATRRVEIGGGGVSPLESMIRRLHSRRTEWGTLCPLVSTLLSSAPAAAAPGLSLLAGGFRSTKKCRSADVRPPGRRDPPAHFLPPHLLYVQSSYVSLGRPAFACCRAQLKRLNDLMAETLDPGVLLARIGRRCGRHSRAIGGNQRTRLFAPDDLRPAPGGEPAAGTRFRGGGEEQPGAFYSIDLPRNDFGHIAVIGLSLRQFPVGEAGEFETPAGRGMWACVGGAGFVHYAAVRATVPSLRQNFHRDCRCDPWATSLISPKSYLHLIRPMPLAMNSCKLRPPSVP
jgi:hypothetical protein